MDFVYGLRAQKLSASNKTLCPMSANTDREML